MLAFQFIDQCGVARCNRKDFWGWGILLWSWKYKASSNKNGVRLQWHSAVSPVRHGHPSDFVRHDPHLLFNNELRRSASPVTAMRVFPVLRAVLWPQTVAAVSARKAGAFRPCLVTVLLSYYCYELQFFIAVLFFDRVWLGISFWRYSLLYVFRYLNIIYFVLLSISFFVLHTKRTEVH